MWMGILVTGESVCRPPRVSNSERGAKGRLVQMTLKFCHLSLLLPALQTAVDDSDTRRVVTPVLEPFESIQKNVTGRSPADVPNYSTHRIPSWRVFLVIPARCYYSLCIVRQMLPRAPEAAVLSRRLFLESVSLARQTAQRIVTVGHRSTLQPDRGGFRSLRRLRLRQRRRGPWAAPCREFPCHGSDRRLQAGVMPP